jgi:hypothetical protein
MLFAAILLVFALWWLKEMLGRWRSDLEELRDPQTEWIPRLCLIGLWLVTLVIAIAAFSFIISIVIMAMAGLRALL